jgi:hypothetical protein
MKNILLAPAVIATFLLSIILGLFKLAYTWLIKIPNDSSHLLGVIRLVLWFVLILTLTDHTTSIGKQWNELDKAHPFIVGVVFTGAIFVITLLQLFIAAGFSYTVPQQTYYVSERNSSNPQGENMSEGFEFLNQMLNQQSTRGKVSMLSQFFGGKL